MCSRLPSAYSSVADTMVFSWERQMIRRAVSLARFNAGSSIAARIAMIAITIRSSVRVKS